MEFQNEHLIPGNIGHFLALLSFVASIVGAISFFISTRSKLPTNESHWYRLGRSAFTVHALSVFGVFSILFYLIFNHYFEYHYVWDHSSKALPFKYLLSCFWEGQEGSFLLWMIWHSILGLIYLRKKTQWTAPVMSVVSLAQFFLSVSLLGLYFFGEKIGSSPFALLRDVMSEAPIFQQANYLTLIQDGNGLNPLLQNYWMVIHPPVLFLGFASTLFPFAYVIAALWKNNYDNWIQPVIRWSLFGGMILGTGIMMGGAWAYESLNFGGYWAWDPVENSSLVPWLVLIAGLHTAVIYKATKYSLRSTLLFLMLSFVLVLYSTFLTRTGILGETSVHAFTGEGNYLGIYLVLFLLTFLLGGLALFFYRYKSIPDHRKEEELSSREFWMFIGSLVLMISVVQITYTTSMPVWNEIFGTKLTVVDPVEHYNSIQIWLAILVALGTALIYYLKFKKTSTAFFIKKILPPFIASAIISALIIYFQDLSSVPVAILMFCGVFTVVANAAYIAQNKKLNIKKWGGNMAHIGFGLMLIGIVLSSFNKNVISVNRLGVDFDMGKETVAENKKESRENLLLFRDIPVDMAGYSLTYEGDTVVGPDHFYSVRYIKRENDTGRITEEFILKPNAQINPKMGLVSNPDTKHYLTKDIFTYITSTVDKSKIKDTIEFKTKEVSVGDSIYFTNGVMIYRGFGQGSDKANYQAQDGDIAVTANLDLMDLNGKTSKANPIYYIRNKRDVFNPIDTIRAFNLYLRVNKIIPERKTVEIAYKQPSSMDDYIIMKAIEFPYINVLWIGIILMVLGFLLSLYKRFTSK